MVYYIRLEYLLLALANALMLALAMPVADQGVTANHSSHGAHAPLTGPLGNGVPLRIMALGASITYGRGSSTGNGYRADLRAQLVAAGNPVNMVGSRQAGSMRDNDVEGWPGFRIDQVHRKAVSVPSFFTSSSSSSSKKYNNDNNTNWGSDNALVAGAVARWRPNVVLLNAGTNDALQDHEVATAGARMEALLRDIGAASPRALVVLSTLVVNRDPPTERNVAAINAQYRVLAARLRVGGGGDCDGDGDGDGDGNGYGRGRAGFPPVVLAEMHDDPAAPRPDTDLADSIHPNDAGYRKMAAIWLRALREASDAGMLRPPEPVPGLADDGAL